MDKHLCPLEPPHPPLTKMLYNQIYRVNLHCTPNSRQQQVMNLIPTLILLVLNFLPVLLPIIRNPKILLPLEVSVYLFHHLFIYHIL